MRRTILAIIVGIIVLGGIALGVVYYNQKSTVLPTLDNNTAPTLKKVLDEQVISPVAGITSDTVWYFNSDGHLFQVNPDGSNISEFPLPALPSGKIKRALWPTTGHDFVAVTTNNTKIYYDSKNKIFVNLPNNIQYLDWMPDGKRIVYIWLANDGKTQQLTEASADGSGFKTIKSVFWPDLAVKVSPDGQTALLYRLNAQDTNKIYAANLQTGDLSTVIDSGKNVAATWITSDKFLYQHDNKIFLYDMGSKATQDLSLNTTLDKVVSDGSAIYAAVSNNDTTDTFVKVDLATYRSSSYFDPTEDVRAKNLFLIAGNLFFTGSDGKLYSISK